MTQLLEAPAIPALPQIDFDELLRETRPARPKLSEAMRRGVQATLPTWEVWQFEDGQGHSYACAIGAACYAVDRQWQQQSASMDEGQVAKTYFPALYETVEVDASLLPGLRYHYPYQFVVNTWKGSLMSLIVELNDDCRYDRGRIADIVEQLGY
jgi:hypothetical protein